MVHAAGTSAVEIEGLTVVIDGRPIVRDFSLRISPGDKVALIGPSGAGKSTVLRCILGLLRPTAGTIRVFGRPLNGQSVWDIRQHLAYVAQEPDLGSGSVREVIERPFTYRANAHLRDELSRLGEWLDRFNLGHQVLEMPIQQLSGGEKQRIALIGAMLLRRPILLMDEASSALDETNRQRVAEYVREQQNLTVLSVAHEAGTLDVAQRTVELSNPASATLPGEG